MSVAGIGELRFCSQWAFKQAPLSHVLFCISSAFLYTTYFGHTEGNIQLSAPRYSYYYNRMVNARANLLTVVENCTTVNKLIASEGEGSWCIALNRKPITDLWSITCHMGSHSVSCHPTQVNAPCLKPCQTGRCSIYLPQKDGRLS